MQKVSPDKKYLSQLKKVVSSDTYTILLNWWQHLKEERQYSPHTLESYMCDINSFISFLSSHYNTEVSSKTLENSTVADFRTFLSKISKVRGANSRGRSLSSVRSFYRFCESNEGLVNENIFLIRSPKKPKSLPRALSVESTFEAIDTASKISGYKQNSEYWISVRDEALLLLIYSSGLRISEALNLKIEDINDSGYLSILGKGNKERLVPILSPALKKLKEVIEVCPFCKKENPESKIFFGKQGKRLNPGVFQRLVREVKNALGLPEETTPHAFRHSFATHLLSNSGDLRSIQELLGHSSLSSTQIYTKVEATNLLKNFSSVEGS